MQKPSGRSLHPEGGICAPHDSAFCLLGSRRAVDLRRSARLSQSHWHHSFCPLADPTPNRHHAFLSNYDGSWESYLEDFIARLHAGLSAIWSNTRDFPTTINLVEKGAEDGERFKRWARRHQSPTLCWYSAYPELKTNRIRTNAAIRHGFAGATTEEAARSVAEFSGLSISTCTALLGEQTDP